MCAHLCVWVKTRVCTYFEGVELYRIIKTNVLIGYVCVWVFANVVHSLLFVCHVRLIYIYIYIYRLVRLAHTYYIKDIRAPVCLPYTSSIKARVCLSNTYHCASLRVCVYIYVCLYVCLDIHVHFTHTCM